jgi:hypothetical protein
MTKWSFAQSTATGDTRLLARVSMGFDWNYLADGETHIYGTGSDATITYDGTNLVINPQVVGSGDISVAAGGITVTAGDVTLTAGDVIATAGTLAVNDYATVTQGTNKQTTVVNSNYAGQIVTHNEALAAAAETTSINDCIILNIQSGGTPGEYFAAVTTVAAGSFQVSISNLSGSSAADVITLNFVVIKAN